ncbi:UNC93-like protein MFSD11 [Ischnura elegans]|uniref:UNC93-like protein MFSD11 n=1 Tax=Ischnura elegans TaxID=197161 RepID=UPI001ED87DBA|nr:UNC93-like protein MFSD11 [Ischnura elegans]
MEIDRKFVNVIILGFGFMFVFTAFQTMGNIEQTVLTSLRHDDPSFPDGAGYTSLSVIYAVFAVCNWIAPSILSVTGPKIAMLVGAVTYALFIMSFLIPRIWLLYTASAVMGFGAAIIWTGQGNYLTLNSDSSTMSRNSGIFWAMLQSSMFVGNLFVYFQFQGKDSIDADTRLVVFIVLAAVAGVGIVFLLLLRTAVPTDSNDSIAVAEDVAPLGPVYALKRSFALFITKDMILLSLVFFYTGLELSFYSGVYSPSIGFTKQLGDSAKQLIGLSGIFIGVGEVVGGMLFGILGKRTIRWGRDPIVLIGFLTHILTFCLIFLNLPDSAPFKDTFDLAYIKTNAYLAILCSFLLGFGDSCFNTQIYSILGGLYADDSAPAFALFKFTQSVAAAISFYYSSKLGLYIQLAILVATACIGTLSFCVVEWRSYIRDKKQGKGEIDNSCGQGALS